MMASCTGSMKAGPSETVHGLRGWLSVLVAFMVVASGCGGSARDGAADPDKRVERLVAVDEPSLRPPGTELAPGVEVQAGSALVGTSMPIVDFYREPGAEPEALGWQAVLIVEGDPIEVWDRYIAHLGFEDERAHAVGSCTVQAVLEPTERDWDRFVSPVERFITEPRIEAENRLACHAEGPTVTMVLAAGAMSCLDWKLDDPPCPLHRASHLYISVLDAPDDHGQERFGAEELGFERSEQAMPSGATREPVPLPTGAVIPPTLDDELVSRLPEEGERYDDELDYYLDGSAAALVPEGGRSLVAPAMLLDCNSGLVALLEVPGTPAQAVDTFDRADEDDGDILAVVGADPQGRSWKGGRITTAGGYYLDLVALDIPRPEAVKQPPSLDAPRRCPRRRGRHSEDSRGGCRRGGWPVLVALDGECRRSPVVRRSRPGHRGWR